MAKDAESDIAIRLVDENDYREISAKAVSAKRKLKKNHPSYNNNNNNNNNNDNNNANIYTG